MEQKNALVRYWKSNFSFEQSVLDAFTEIDRRLFVTENYLDEAYDDHPLPLLRGKTISQPTTVMIMTSALALEKGHKVFEIGTGSGYQSAIISHMVGAEGKVFTTEIIPELVSFAKTNFARAGIHNVSIVEMEGSDGLPDEAPFDRIIITAACKEIPKPLIDQLKEDGIIVAPVGERDQQVMVKGVKKLGKLQSEFLGPFLFTPMYGKYGFEI